MNKRFVAAALLLCGCALQSASAVEWNGYLRRVGIGHSAGYHVYDACPWMHTRHTRLAHSVNGWYYGGHPKYQLHSPNAGFYSTQWCQIAPFGPSYAGLHNYTPSAPYRGVYPLSGCDYDSAPYWSDEAYPGELKTPPGPEMYESIEPVEAATPAASDTEKPAEKPASPPPTSRKRPVPTVRQTSVQPVVKPVR